MPPSLVGQVLLSFNPLAGNRSGLQWSALRLWHIRGCVFRHCSASLAVPAFHLVRPLLTSPRYSASVARRPASMLRSTGEISRGKTRYLHCIDAGFTKRTLLPQMEDVARTCPLVPNASRLISGFCSSPRSFGFGVPAAPRACGVQAGTSKAVCSCKPRLHPSDPASRRRPCPSPCLRFCITWPSDFHRRSNAPCPAHT